ncbi:Murein hydrolase activator NlpD [Serratia symbiotica]|nr:Murein hydrolase activator NlpD [Serratia symbiotica]
MINLRRVAVCIMLSFCLVGCMNTTTTACPITRVGVYGVARSDDCNVNHARPARGMIYNRTYELSAKGSYIGNQYIVRHGDTLFYIAWITGNDLWYLAQQNHISEPYKLNVGQSIQLSNRYVHRNGVMLVGTNITKGGVSKQLSSKHMQTKIVNFHPTNAYSNNDKQNVLSKVGSHAVSPLIAPIASRPFNNTVSIRSWRWPSEGKVIDNFSSSEGGNKGVDIAGPPGHPIFAAARGCVVYAGNALRGYGNLIIIKHNDDYLSAYAHNETMLVREQQEVKAGQKVATMGSTGTSSVRLHFEIRYKGKSVNPLNYLPKR